MVCIKHGETPHSVRKSGYKRCKKCSVDAVQKRQRQVQKELKLEFGGQCILCGYGKCLQALEWHHINPKLKSFGIGTHGYRRSLKVLREEVQKCILLCANCHREVEYKITLIPNSIG